MSQTIASSELFRMMFCLDTDGSFAVQDELTVACLELKTYQNQVSQSIGCPREM
jgi:hypothetical protein